MSLFSIATSSLTDDVLMLFVMLASLLLSSCLGQSAGRRHGDSRSNTELAVILCLTGLLTGFAFFISVAGFVARQKSETNEVQSVGRAWQYSGLLNDIDRDKSRQILMLFLHERIHFFQENTAVGLRTWGQLAKKNQQQLFQLAELEASQSGRPNAMAVLDTYADLGDCIIQTQSVWRRQLPDAAWWTLMLFALSLCYIVGYGVSGEMKNAKSLIFVPVLMALGLFMIAEIDLPGQGIIHVLPDGLQSLAEELNWKSPY